MHRAAETENEQKKSRRELVERVLLRYIARLKAAAALRAEFDELTQRSVTTAAGGSTKGGGGDGGAGGGGDGHGQAAVQPTGAELFRATSVLLFASRLVSTPDRGDHARWLHLAKAIVASLHPSAPPER